MQKKPNLKWHGITVAFVLIVTAFAALFTMNLSTPASAQGLDPTATPTDPTWLGFVTGRAAVEEERNVNLSIVQNWSFEQTPFDDGIEIGCIDDFSPFDASPSFYGWTFRITDLRGTTHQVRVSFDLRYTAVCTRVTESGPAANPEATADPSLDLPAPLVGSGATGSFELGGHVDGLGPDTVTAMNRAGMNWVKKQLRYSPGGGTSTAQSMIEDAHGKGFKILLGIVGRPSDMGNFDGYVAQYADFVGQVAALGPDAIEVWNEPNIGREWPSGQISGANYTRLLAPAFNAIKTANPNVMVISGAPAPTGAEAVDPANIKNDDNFMAEMAAAGAANFLDCVGIHYNEGIVAPSASTGDPRDNYPTRYFGSMLARGRASFPSRPVCFTELGYLSGDGFNTPIPAAFAWAEGVSVQDHARWLAEAASLAATGGRVRLMIIWNVNFQAWGSDPMGGYAIMRPDGSCPACSTLGAVMGA
jgi:hypothetical protein